MIGVETPPPEVPVAPSQAVPTSKKPGGLLTGCAIGAGVFLLLAIGLAVVFFLLRMGGNPSVPSSPVVAIQAVGTSTPYPTRRPYSTALPYKTSTPYPTNLPYPTTGRMATPVPSQAHGNHHCSRYRYVN